MEIVKTLNISAADFFDKLTNSVIYDIYQSTGERLQPQQLENHTYFKLYSKNTGSTITITSFKQNQVYAYEAVTSRNSFTANYQVVPLSETSCQVIYHEKMVSYQFMQKLNDALLGTVLSPFKKKRFKNMLIAIEKSV